MHSAIAPNMNRCIKCGAWIGSSPENTRAASGGDSASPEQRARDVADSIVRDICEADPADPDSSDTVSVHVSLLRIIVERTITAALANQQGVEFPDVSDADISAWLDRHDLTHAIRGSDARAAFEDAQSFVLTQRSTQPAGDAGPTCNRNCDCVGRCKMGIEG